jgi:polyhydroxyalkanoate synthesis regulator protein
VLTQIVVEQSKGEDSTFPLDVLRQMIAASGKATKDAALTYVKAVSEIYQNAYRTVAPIVPNPAAPAADVDALLKRVEELESTVSTMRSKRAAAPRAAAKKKRR